MVSSAASCGKMPSSVAVVVLAREFELVGGVDLRVELDRLDGRALETQRLQPVAAVAGRLHLQRARQRIGIVLLEITRSTAAIVGSSSTMPPLSRYGEPGKVVMAFPP